MAFLVSPDSCCSSKRLPVNCLLSSPPTWKMASVISPRRYGPAGSAIFICCPLYSNSEERGESVVLIATDSSPEISTSDNPMPSEADNVPANPSDVSTKWPSADSAHATGVVGSPNLTFPSSRVMVVVVC